MGRPLAIPLPGSRTIGLLQSIVLLQIMQYDSRRNSEEEFVGTDQEGAATMRSGNFLYRNSLGGFGTPNESQSAQFASLTSRILFNRIFKMLF